MRGVEDFTQRNLSGGQATVRSAVCFAGSLPAANSIFQMNSGLAGHLCVCQLGTAAVLRRIAGLLIPEHEFWEWILMLNRASTAVPQLPYLEAAEAEWLFHRKIAPLKFARNWARPLWSRSRLSILSAALLGLPSLALAQSSTAPAAQGPVTQA